MIKNAVDVIFGALGYWLCGFAFSFGNHEYSNGFTGFGNFLTDSTDDDYGTLYAKYFFQLSFATTATTIVSGAMAERTNLKAYMFFSFLNFTSYVFPAHWIWDDKGFLKKLNVLDAAGAGPVHVVGGVSAIIATVMLKPRHGVFIKGDGKNRMASPTNVMLGTFMLWWGWLGFNCGSTFGVSGGKWKLASRAAVTTVNSSVGSGIWSIIFSFWVTKEFKGKLDVGTFTSGILGGLVSSTAICAVCRPWEALLIGFVGGVITTYGAMLIRYLEIDDPVQCIPVHGFCGVWGLFAVGIFAEKDGNKINSSVYRGVTKGGPWSFLGYQCLAIVCIAAWAAVNSFIQLYLTDKIIGLRVSLANEIAGADFTEHGISNTHIYGLKSNNVRNNIQEDEVPTTGIAVELTEKFYNQGMLNYGYTINNPRDSLTVTVPSDNNNKLSLRHRNKPHSADNNVILMRRNSLPDLTYANTLNTV